MLTKFENFDSGSNYRFGDKMDKPSVKRSLFDLSHLVSLTYPKEGAIIPITWWEALLGDDFDIDVDALLRFQPLTVPPYSRQRLFVYGFFVPYNSLWSNWQSFIRHGMNGTYNGLIPTYNSNNTYFASGLTRDIVVPDSLLDYLGLPQGFDSTTFLASNISVLPQMGCFRVWRDYFCCKDEYMNDRILFPEDDSRFRLDDNGRLLSALDNSKKCYFLSLSNTTSSFGSYSVESSGNVTFQGMWHEFPQDYFTSAKPFIQRGSAQFVELPYDLNLISKGWSPSTSDPVLFIKNVSDGYTSNFPNLVGDGQNYDSSTPSARNPPFLSVGGTSSSSLIQEFNDSMVDAICKSVGVSSNGSIKLYTDDLRKMLINQLELEKLAHTDGSYAQFGLTFFGEKPSSAVDYRPVYIGGTYKSITFTQVLQTSATSSSSYLGSYAGHGISGMSNGRIGHIHCSDYGMIMLFAVILPDTYYSEGLDKKFTRSVQEDFFLPGREKLGMQPILNKEIYAFGSTPNDLWAYQDSWDEYRYIPNSVRGKMADPNNLSWFPYTQSRHFTAQPNWGRNFSTTQNNVRSSMYTSSLEDICSMQFSINVRAVRPLPYRPTVGHIIN